MLVRTITIAAAALALGAAPASALPGAATDNPGTAFQQANQPADTPTQSSNPGTAASEGAAPTDRPTAENNPGTSRRLASPGQFCKAASKKPVEGQKGTPFSKCVKAQAQLRRGATRSPREACKALSKKPAEGKTRSEFSICVAAGAKLLRDRAEAEKAPEPPAQS